MKDDYCAFFNKSCKKKHHKVLKMIKCDATGASLGAVIVSLYSLCSVLYLSSSILCCSPLGPGPV